MSENKEKRQRPTSENEEFSSTSETELDEEAMGYIEEPSDSEPELECDIWDEDCRILSGVNFEEIIGRHLMATCSKDPDLHPHKKIKLQPSLNPHLIALDNLKEIWADNTPLSNEHLEIITDPFKVCILKNLLENPDLLKELRQELFDLTFNWRNMDLYEFFQSKDLKYLQDSPFLKSIYEFLNGDLKDLVSKITGYNFTNISATCSLYTNTDYLLLHDDQREDRMVAFILYLNDFGWEKGDGGFLELFSKDKNGQPCDVKRELAPVANQLVFFPVTNDSYHQVAEVTTLTKYRLSINGWFHTKPPPVFQTPLYKSPTEGLYSQNSIKPKDVDINLESWINDDYLDNKAIKMIQSHIEENSEISLKSFLKRECFQEVLSSLTDVEWIKVGPSNRFCYEKADLGKLPHIIERCLDLFQCKQMFLLLERYTDLELGKGNASMKFEFQRWRPGNYALLTEYDWSAKNELDLIIYFGCKNSDVIGARTHYVTIEDEVQNALITIDPDENNLNIVYRDSARFTKYFSKQSKCQCFYVLVCSYSE